MFRYSCILVLYLNTLNKFEKRLVVLIESEIIYAAVYQISFVVLHSIKFTNTNQAITIEFLHPNVNSVESGPVSD